jgi:hypothetical protein
MSDKKYINAVCKELRLTQMGSVCLAFHILKISVETRGKHIDYHVALNWANPIAWPFIFFMESIGFCDDLWCDGLRLAILEIGRTTNLFSGTMTMEEARHE